MKKLLIGSLVGGVLIFVWQTLSWTAILDLHHSHQEYTPKQDTILSFLNSQFSETGSYLMPSVPKGTSSDEMEKKWKEGEGKPWVELQYHKSFSVNMGSNIVRGLLVDIIMVTLLVWILMKLNPSSFSITFSACLLVGLIVFINSPYTMHIWYPKTDIMAHLIDAIVSWGLCGIWLGWWLNRKK